MHSDFDRSSSYVGEQGLQNHITFVSFSARDKTLPLNSDRHILDAQNIVVQDLTIELDDRLAWDKVQDWVPISSAKLHFERCQFQSTSSSMWAFTIPWRGSFRFYQNLFSFRSSRHPGVWVFPFKPGSRVWFEGNNFDGCGIQTRCVSSPQRTEDSQDTAEIEAWKRFGRISFVGNGGVRGLSIQEGFPSVEITGMNRIGRLNVDLIIDDSERTSIYLGSREKIDLQFHNCLQHRSLFLAMRRLAAMNHDNRQLVVLDRQLERIEYFLNKEKEIPSLSNYWVWIEYWQDRAHG